jgi:hypothetical protein
VFAVCITQLNEFAVSITDFGKEHPLMIEQLASELPTIALLYFNGAFRECTDVLVFTTLTTTSVQLVLGV